MFFNKIFIKSDKDIKEFRKLFQLKSDLDEVVLQHQSLAVKCLEEYVTCNELSRSGMH